MIKTEITIFARFRETFGSHRTIEFEESSEVYLKDALKKLCDETKGGFEILFDDDGEFLDSVLLMHNKKRVDPDEADKIIIKDGDGIVLYPPVSGG
ncbi:MoaD/ThiS family protein [Methanoplanus sp. FWC-SCC4]|uniref:MoaD/ThiS family protein n=1 Tax=Methanochimaera problematica TaxID=2609417 RepID=A0AA97F9B2_9EURY|nr:MoaD/ThiS family protein [Methanoplanus sp. FWC-SCC4]WOF15185.1 MoaD/ThiS family protein [Methanoplanus sp. FWC-SCC4]